ncbi:MAG: hypothetical protein CBB71_10410 [Rhodopirellula sp. TMED11]|nr:MAG: hypothetical protein CBB71_10410 [Rhodopirellula sp. TMED11]
MDNLQVTPEANSEDGSLCARCHSPLEQGDLRCAICGEVAPAKERATLTTVVTKILRCTGCGAAIGYDIKHQAPACSFCGGVVEEESVSDPMEQTEMFLPFTVTEQQAQRALKQWLANQGWSRPSDLASTATFAGLKPLWWVGWVFHAEAQVSWAADSDAGSRRSSWAPHSGQTTLQFNRVLVSASRGLTNQEANAITPGMNLQTAQSGPGGARADAIIEQFDVQRSQARREVIAAIERLSAESVQRTEIPGRKFRNVAVSLVLRGLHTQRYALPAYVIAYRYKEQLYRVVICGQDTKLVIGKAPRSLMKTVVLPIVIVIVIALIFLLFSAF